ncbi:MAG TPA: GNAT family N-acetyltransferase [Dongiaceae bacterium]
MAGDAAPALQPLGPFDLEVAASIHRDCFETPWTAQSFSELMAMPGTTGLYAMQEAVPAGLVLFQLQPPDAEILTLAVLPGLRRRGIGGRLLKAAADHARLAGATRLLLEVAADNDPAASLYRRLGFQPLSRRRKYYRRAGGPPMDAEVLVLELAKGAE